MIEGDTALRGNDDGSLDPVTLSVLASLVIRCGGAVELPATELNKWFDLDVQWHHDRGSFVLVASRTPIGESRPDVTQ